MAGKSWRMFGFEGIIEMYRNPEFGAGIPKFSNLEKKDVSKFF